MQIYSTLPRTDVLSDKPHPQFLKKFWVKGCDLSAGVYGTEEIQVTCKIFYGIPLGSIA